MYLIYYYLISVSILGYGLLINKSFKINSKNLGIIGFIGIFFLILVSYLSTLFLAHDYHFNSFILVVGLALAVYFFKNFHILKVDLINFFLVFSILFIFILVGKNHDDFPYYHFPYIHLLTQDSHHVGLGLLNNGFRNQSSLFFFNSLFYLPKIDIYFYHIGAVFFLGFTNLFFLKNIFDKNTFKKFRFYNLINLFFLIFVNIFFYRLAEYGTDRLGSILVILAFIILLFIINQNNKSSQLNDELIKFFIIIGSITISMKPFYLIYISLLFFLMYYSHLRKFFFKFFKSKLFILIFFFVFFSFFFNFINSSCIVFPAQFTCYDNLSWSISKNEVENVRNWYELWAKGGATPNFVVENRVDYISNFNWVKNWLNVYFFNKMSDYILSIILLVVIFYFTFSSKVKGNFEKRKYYIILFFLVLYLIEWFLFHPSLRYGGYHIFILLFSIPLMMIVEKFQLSWVLFRKKAIILIMVSILIFLGRNVLRLNKEYNLYNYNIFKNMNYKFIGGDQNHHLRYDKLINEKNFNHEYKVFFGKKILVIKNQK